VRVLFLALYPDIAASPRYRVGQFLPYLRQRGIEFAVAPAISEARYAARGRPFGYHVSELMRRVGDIVSASRYDVVFVQKAIMSVYVRGLASWLRRRARAMVFDLDDAVHLRPPNLLRGAARIFEDRTQAATIMSQADLVLAGNRWLAEEAARWGKRVEHFPTVVDTRRFAPPRRNTPSAEAGRYIVGWIGGPSTTPHLAVAAEALAQTNDMAVCLVGADPGQNPVPSAEVIPWSYETEVASLHRFSVGIMPLPKDDWTRGKCALKALQYMACGIPCVATSYGAVLDMIEHDRNGLFADSPDEWHAALERLRDPALRRRLGEAARATVEEHFSLERAAPQFADLLESVA
jgi:glycosyltransferase involved in cell wall biosynthesis